MNNILIANGIDRLFAGAPLGNRNAAKDKIKEEAKLLARQVNDPNFKGDRHSVSMRLSMLMKKMGAMGVDSASGESDESEIDASLSRLIAIESLSRRLTLFAGAPLGNKNAKKDYGLIKGDAYWLHPNGDLHHAGSGHESWLLEHRVASEKLENRGISLFDQAYKKGYVRVKRDGLGKVFAAGGSENSKLDNFLNRKQKETLESISIERNEPVFSDNSGKKIVDFSNPIKSSFADPLRKIKARHDRVRDVAEKIYMAALIRLLAQAEAEVLRKVHLNGANNGGVVKSAMPNQHAPYRVLGASEDDLTTPLDVNFDLSRFTRNFKQRMDEAADEAYSVCARGLLDDQDLEGRVTDQGIIQKFAFARANKIKDCPQNIFNEIQNSLDEGNQAGETMDELAGRVKKAFKEITKGRALVIARTESQSAYGTAQMNVLKVEGYASKFWQTSDDERVRLSHMECEEQGSIPVGEEFENGLDFPGDPHGPASEVIGCRCFLLKGEPEEETTEEDDL